MAEEARKWLEKKPKKRVGAKYDFWISLGEAHTCRLLEQVERLRKIEQAAHFPYIGTAFVNDQGIELPEFIQVRREDIDKLQEVLDED